MRCAPFVILGVALASFVPSSVRAICGRPSPAYVDPFAPGLAPRNTHVRVRMAASYRTRGMCAPDPSDAQVERCPVGDFDVALRAAPAVGSRSELLPVRSRESIARAVATLELVPLQTLDARTRYEVVYTDRSGRTAERVIGTFVTSEQIDTSPPSWPGIVRAFSTGHPASSPRGTITILPECMTESVVFIVAPAADDATPTDAVRFAIWMGDEHDVIDYASPPLVYEAARMEQAGPTVELGGSEVEDTFAAPKGRRHARFGIRAIDWAGNVSSPSEIDVRF